MTAQLVLITGGARGIGRATAKAFLDAGSTVAISDIDADEVAATAADLGVRGDPLDVTDRAEFEAWIAALETDLGPVDVLINNAGIMPIGPFLNESEDSARRVLEVNVLGTLNGMAAALPGMVARGHGHVVNMASIAGKAPVPGGLSYAASKAAIVSATESARVEHHDSGVHFTCVMPSFTATDLILGTKGTKFIKTITPDAVAAAVVKAVAKRRADVFVPGPLGALVKLQPLLGRRLRDASQRSIGAYDTFLDVDESARASYVQRIARAKAAPVSPPRS